MPTEDRVRLLVRVPGYSAFVLAGLVVWAAALTVVSILAEGAEPGGRGPISITLAVVGAGSGLTLLCFGFWAARTWHPAVFGPEGVRVGRGPWRVVRPLRSVRSMHLTPAGVSIRRFGRLRLVFAPASRETDRAAVAAWAQVHGVPLTNVRVPPPEDQPA